MYKRESRNIFFKQARHRLKLSGPQSVTLKWVKNHLKSGDTVLDIGTGQGYLLANLEHVGFRAVGLEISPSLVEMLVKKDFKVHLGSITSYPDNWPQPNLLTALDVIEHLSEPVPFLKSIRDKFPDIPLIISTPSPRSWQHKLGLYPTALDYPPNHLLRFSEASFKEALVRAGYNKIELVFPAVIASELWLGLSSHFVFKRMLGVMPNSDALATDKREKVRVFWAILRRFFPLINWLWEKALPTLTLPITYPMARYLTYRGASDGAMVAIAN